MAEFTTRPVTQDWLDYVKQHVRLDPETGELFWAIRMKGRRVNKPIGCLDSNGYVKCQIANVSCYAHQVVFFLTHGRWPRFLIDHENKTRNDNRPSNLIESDHTANALNSGLWSTNTSGVKGASIAEGKYKVTKQGKHLGYFETKEEAEDAYNRHS